MAKEDTEGSGDETLELIRVDTGGRRRYTEEFRREAVSAFGRSGMSGVQFARRCGVKYSTFAKWAKRAREGCGRAGGPGRGQRFAVAEIEGVRAEPPAGDVGELVVELPCGGVARVGTPGGADLLCRLLRGMASGGVGP